MIRNTTIPRPQRPIVSVPVRFDDDRQTRDRDENMHQQGGAKIV